MNVRLDPVHAAPALRAVAPTTRRRLRVVLRWLGEDPSGRSHDLDVKRLDRDAGDPIYRARVGDWRIAYTVRGPDVLVVRIFHRREGYGWLADMP